VVLPINGQRHYLWRAVDQDDHVLDILGQSRHNKKAAKKFFRTLLKGLQYVPRVLITDKLKRYGAAKREILPGVEHRQSRYLHNRCEHSHRPTRQRAYRMQQFPDKNQCQICWTDGALKRCPCRCLGKQESWRMQSPTAKREHSNVHNRLFSTYNEAPGIAVSYARVQIA
jgi:hypothetical protein